METILASIRRIISEEETPAAERAEQQPDPDEEDLVILNDSMIVQPVPVPVPAAAATPVTSTSVSSPAPATAEPLLAPETQAAASRALESLHEALRPLPAPEAGPMLLRSGGPSLEDLVRDELRAQLKSWLDTNLPGLVERLVRIEIERVVRRG